MAISNYPSSPSACMCPNLFFLSTSPGCKASPGKLCRASQRRGRTRGGPQSHGQARPREPPQRCSAARSAAADTPSSGEGLSHAWQKAASPQHLNQLVFAQKNKRVQAAARRDKAQHGFNRKNNAAPFNWEQRATAASSLPQFPATG